MLKALHSVVKKKSGPPTLEKKEHPYAILRPTKSTTSAGLGRVFFPGLLSLESWFSGRCCWRAGVGNMEIEDEDPAWLEACMAAVDRLPAANRDSTSAGEGKQKGETPPSSRCTSNSSSAASANASVHPAASSAASTVVHPPLGPRPFGHLPFANGGGGGAGRRENPRASSTSANGSVRRRTPGVGINVRAG